MIPDCQKRLQIALEDLKTLVVSLVYHLLIKIQTREERSPEGRLEEERERASLTLRASRSFEENSLAGRPSQTGSLLEDERTEHQRGGLLVERLLYEEQSPYSYLSRQASLYMLAVILICFPLHCSISDSRGPNTRKQQPQIQSWSPQQSCKRRRALLDQWKRTLITLHRLRLRSHLSKSMRMRMFRVNIIR